MIGFSKGYEFHYNTISFVLTVHECILRVQGSREDWGGPGQIQKVGPHEMDGVRGVWGQGPRKFRDLHALKCILVAPEALFRACTQYIYTCKLPFSISGFRSKNATYGALARGLRSVSSMKREAREQVDFSPKYSETNPLKKLDWNVTLLGGLLTLWARYHREFGFPGFWHPHAKYSSYLGTPE